MTCHDPTLTHDASAPGFNYYGRWQRGRQAITINSGALVEFAYTGNDCTLIFDVAGFTHYPAILVQVDAGPVVKTELSAEVNAIEVAPPHNALPDGAPPFEAVVSGHHLVRFWAACHSLYLTEAAGRQWTTLVGGCKFLGVNLNGGGLTQLPYQTRQIEFLGDSITQGLRLFYTQRHAEGAEGDIDPQMPHLNWPQLVADMLGMKPVVTGFGGQGVSNAGGTCGAPAVPAAFPFIYDGVPWRPPVPPRLVVIYHGTCDGIEPLAYQELYASYLALIRRTYPAAAIYAVCPHPKPQYAAPIQNAVNQTADPAIRFLDYSTGVIAIAETCDGCHLNPGGAVRLATRLAKDLVADMMQRRTAVTVRGHMNDKGPT